MAGRSQLEALLTELLEVIGTCLSPADLNKGIDFKIQRTFLHSTFDTMAFMLYDAESIQKAIKVARHPVFGPTVHTLCFYIDKIEAIQPPDHGGVIHGPNTLNKDQTLYLLVTLFSYLRRSGNLRRLQIVELPTAHALKSISTPYTRLPIVIPTAPADTTHDDADTQSQNINAVTEAISLSNLRLSSLDIFITHDLCFIDLMSTDRINLSAVVQILSQLTELRITMALCGHHGNESAEFEHIEPWLLELLKKFWKCIGGALGQLKKLTIRSRFADNAVWPRGFSQTTQVNPFAFELLTRDVPAVEELTVHSCLFHIKELKAFLESHPKINRLALRRAILGPRFENLGSEETAAEYLVREAGMRDLRVDKDTELHFEQTRLQHKVLTK